MTRPAQLPPDSALMLMHLVDALDEHPSPDAAAGSPALRAQWEAAGEREQRRVLAAVARDARHGAAPRGVGSAGEYARRLHAAAAEAPDGEPGLGPILPPAPLTLQAALVLLDTVRRGRDRPARGDRPGRLWTGGQLAYVLVLGGLLAALAWGVTGGR